jgi:hypothetical protein
MHSILVFLDTPKWLRDLLLRQPFSMLLLLHTLGSNAILIMHSCSFHHSEQQVHMTPRLTPTGTWDLPERMQAHSIH